MFRIIGETMNAYFLMQYGNDENSRLILEKPSQDELANFRAQGWIVWDISYKIGDLPR